MHLKTLTISIVAVLCALATAFPALGATRPDDRAGVRGPGTAAETAQAFAADPASSARPDNRAGVLGVGSDGTEATVAVATGTGFDWADAGIGAGATAGLLMLLGLGLARSIPKRRHGEAAA